MILRTIEPASGSQPIIRNLNEQILIGVGPFPHSIQSGRRGSNPPPSAWKADALPNELLPLIMASVNRSEDVII